MGLRLTLPYSPGEPGPEVGDALPASAGMVLDAGMTWSNTGSGELVITSVGLVACDLESMEMAGVAWPSFDAGSQLSDLGTYASIAMHVDGCGTLTFGIDHRLAANIWAIASQLSEAGEGVEIDGVVTSPGISALIEPEAPAPPAPPAPPALPSRAPTLAGAPAESWWPAPTGATALLGDDPDTETATQTDTQAEVDAEPDLEADLEADLDVEIDAETQIDADADVDPGLGFDNEWAVWRNDDGDDSEDTPEQAADAALVAARLAGPRGRSLFDEGETTVRVPPSLIQTAPDLPPPPVPATSAVSPSVDPGRYRVYTPVLDDEPPASNRRRTWLLGGSVGAVALALAAAGMAFLPLGGDDDTSAAGSSTTTAQSLGSATADDQAAAAGAPDSPVATVGTGRCSSAYLPCLPDLEGDALDCDDLAPDQKPVRLLDRNKDPYQLQGSDRSGVACTS